jgi:hypothetical protein
VSGFFYVIFCFRDLKGWAGGGCGCEFGVEGLESDMRERKSERKGEYSEMDMRQLRRRKRGMETRYKCILQELNPPDHKSPNPVQYRS